jgi:hypothetical protein
MAAPALRIPMQLDMDSFQEQTARASNRVGEVLKLAARQFANVNGEMLGIASSTAAGVGLAWSQTMTRNVLVFAGWATASVAAIKLVGAAIDQAREQLEKMVDIADKAGKAQVSPEFFQRFTAEADKLKVSADDLEGALRGAFDATKEVSPIDVDKWTTGEERVTAVEKALRVYNETLAKAAGQRLDGLVLFRDAETQEGKVLAVLKAMQQLIDIGQRAAALDLGERMFKAGPFMDAVRRGEVSVKELIKTVEEGGAAFSDALVKRAKEVDDQLKIARHTLDNELRPSWETLARVILSIKSLWTDVLNITTAIVRAVNQIDLARKKEELGQVNDAIKNGTGLFGLPQLPRAASEALGIEPAQDSLQKRKQRLQEEIAALEGSREPLRLTVTRDSRGTGAAPTPRQQQTSELRDRFEASADSIEKRTAALQAETANINLSTEARERARIAAELETVAKQINKEAGLGANVVTQEQRDRINEVADAYGRAAAAIEQAHRPLETFARESANVSRQLNGFAAQSLDTITFALADIVTGTRSVTDAFKSMTNAIVSDLARLAIRQSITGPLASALASVLSSIGGGTPTPLPGGPSGIGHNAGGTDNWRGGPTWVGERGPEIVNLPRGAQVIPSPAARAATSAAGGSTYVDIKNYTDQKADVRRQKFGRDEFIEIAIGAVRQDVAEGGFDPVLRGRFAMAPVAAVR